MGERKLKFQDRWMFNRVLCEEEVCRKVLRAALGIEAGEIAYLNAEQCFEPLAAGRGVRLDVFARGDGRVYDIEMQVARERDLGRRMRYYQAAMDVGELGSGEDFGALQFGACAWRLWAVIGSRAARRVGAVPPS